LHSTQHHRIIEKNKRNFIRARWWKVIHTGSRCSPVPSDSLSESETLTWGAGNQSCP
jgi:hypothetical protein